MTEVTLHVYDVSNTDNQNLNSVVQYLNSFTREIHLGGVFHGAIEVYGFEWSFGYCPTGSGLYRVRPRCNELYDYRESVPLSRTSLSQQEVEDVLATLQQDWMGASYDLLQRNCCHFCEEFCSKLGVQGIPGWLNRFAYGADITVAYTSTAFNWVRSMTNTIAQSVTSSSGYLRQNCTQFFLPPATSQTLPTDRITPSIQNERFGIPNNATKTVDMNGE